MTPIILVALLLSASPSVAGTLAPPWMEEKVGFNGYLDSMRPVDADHPTRFAGGDHTPTVVPAKSECEKTAQRAVDRRESENHHVNDLIYRSTLEACVKRELDKIINPPVLVETPTEPETPVIPAPPVEVAPVPLPAAGVLLAGALGVLAMKRRRS